MADDKTRVETVEENIEAVEEKYGPEGWNHIFATCLKDISTSLAMLVDAGSNSET